MSHTSAYLGEYLDVLLKEVVLEAYLRFAFVGYAVLTVLQTQHLIYYVPERVLAWIRFLCATPRFS
jgi:hypothetical protein